MSHTNFHNIEAVVRDLFRQNFELYPECYPVTENGLMSEKGAIAAQEMAKATWAVRHEGEVERDEKAGVTEINYVEWVMAEFVKYVIAELSALIPGGICLMSWDAY